MEENTIFIAEVDGLRSAANYIIENYDNENFTYKSACCYVDSQACIKAVANPIITSKWVLEAVKKLDQAASLLEGGLIIRWVKAHVKRAAGEPYADGYMDTFDPNDKADENAKFAASGNPEALVDIYDLPGKTIATLKTRVFNKSHQFWRKNYVNWSTSKLQIGEMKHFRQFWPEIDSSKSNKLMNQLGRNRRGFSIFIQATSGADYLNKYSYKIGESDSPHCRLCEEDDEEETLFHILTECGAMLTTVRNNFSTFPIVDPSCHPVTQLVSFLLEADIDFLPTE